MIRIRIGSIRHFGRALLILRQLPDALLQLASNGLISLALSIKKSSPIGLKLIVDAGHGRDGPMEKGRHI